MTEHINDLKIKQSDASMNLERAKVIMKQAEQMYIKATNDLAEALPKNGVKETVNAEGTDSDT